jgi:hypothetical protein
VPLSFTIKGIAPNGLETYPDAVRFIRRVAAAMISIEMPMKA